MRINAKGQVTIPRAVREEVGFDRNTKLEVLVEGETLRIVKERPLAMRQRPGESKGEWAVRLLRDSGCSGLDLTTDQIMEMTRGE